MSVKKWNIAQLDKELAFELAKECNIDNFLALLLVSKGISDPYKAEEFLSDEILLQDPNSFVDMDKAVVRIKSAIANNEKIAVFGDYDADGITSTVLLYHFLCNANVDAIYRLPSRNEGYGISKAAIDELKRKKISLIITVDNGISAVSEVDYAKTLGIDVIVTDHHLPPEVLPNAVAVIDPKRKDDLCEFKDYAGVGVAFMLVCAIMGKDCEELLPAYGDLLMLGTIADVMPIRGDNRTFVKYGLQQLLSYKREGIEALLSVAGLDEKPVTSTSIAFGLAPRINAAGRIESPNFAAELLLSENANQAKALALKLNEINAKRQSLQNEVLIEAEKLINEDKKLLFAPVLIVSGKNWPSGIIGIVASSLMQKYGKPCIVLSIQDDIAVASARSYKGVSIFALINAAAPFLIKFGGHETAAGFSLKCSDIDNFTKAVNDAALGIYDRMPFDEINLCCKMNPKMLSVASCYHQQALEPFGAGNEQPVYGLFNLKIAEIMTVGQGKHLKLRLSRNEVYINAMLFSTTLDEFEYQRGDIVDLAVTLNINSYQGNDNLSVIIKAMKPSDKDHDLLLMAVRDYEKYIYFGIKPDIDAPTRDEIGAVYKKIREQKCIVASEETLCLSLMTSDYLKTRIILDILAELSLIEINVSNKIYIKYNDEVKRVDLDCSKILNNFSRR